MGNPLTSAFDRKAAAIVGAPATAGIRRQTELAVDRVLDQRYRILEPIGAGGYSQVYLAQDTALGRQVAVKVLDPAAAADATLRRLFVKEARALAQLSHPNIVGVFDVGEVDGLPFIVMEYVAGTSLKARIERTGPLPVGDAIRFTDEIAAGLTFAHSRGIVHDDMKPSNVMLDKDDHAKICDFGIARTPQEDADSPQLFATALYVAPERVEGRPASVASDIYGLGLVLYEMLVGKPPFTSSNAAVLLRDHVVRPPVPPSHLRPSLPKELDAIVLKALAKDPGLRYSRASELGDVLQRLDRTERTAVTVPLAGRSADDDDGDGMMTMPIRGFVPGAEQSPVVALLSAHGQPIRRGLYGFLAALPLFALLILSGFGPLPGLLAGGLVIAISLLGQLGLGITLAWLVETALIFLFVPGLALLFALMGLWVWLRDVSSERAALAMAMPVTAPFGLAPALILAAAAIHGLGGVVTVAWGAVLAVIFAVASGRQALGTFTQTGLSLEPESLFDPARATDMKGALTHLLAGASNDRFGPLLGQLDPGRLGGQLGGVASRFSGADVTAFATIMAWVVAALVVWTTTRLLRSLFDTILRRPKRWFALYVFATTVGVLAGAAVLYMLFVTWMPLAASPGRPADGLLFVSALTGALLAIAMGVVVSATERPEKEEEPLPAMAGRHSPVR
ncbi:MAG TPA: serine/threonine-protein kinase [Candidatus Saccharimonadales bacterium]|nr:serine/threonine-protein kinase [Candidatus Saccharimonadales bacterium]